MIQQIAIGHGIAGRRLRSIFRVGPRTSRFAASVDLINFDNSNKLAAGFLARGLACFLVGLALGACSSTTDKAVVHPQEKNMSSSASTEAPRLDAPEVLRRLLALVDSVHQPQDLTRERVAQFSGISMQPSSGKPPNVVYSISQPLTENFWHRYVWRPNNATHLPRLGLAFYETAKIGGASPPMTEICELDAAQFQDALLKLGYRHVGNTRRASDSRQYRRGHVEVEIGMYGESGESLEKISHRCIHRVSVGFLVEYMDVGAM